MVKNMPYTQININLLPAIKLNNVNFNNVSKNDVQFVVMRRNFIFISQVSVLKYTYENPS